MAEFQITVPGWSDVIKIRPDSTLPPKERRAKQINRIIAMKKSAVPGVVQRMSQIATYLDNAEDLLSTALVLAKPLLRRLPSKFIPGLGWVLLVKDIFDFGTWILSSATPGMGGKRRAIDQVRSVNMSRGARLQKTAKFFSTRPGVGALIEGLQATDTLFGVGLSLGPLMGLIQETIWTVIRSRPGDRVRIQVPTPPTPVQKSAQFLLQNPMMMGFGAALEIDDALKVMAAQEVAIDFLRASVRPEDVLSRGAMGDVLAMPQLVPNNELTREILKEQGIDPDREEPAPPPFGEKEAPSINAVIDASLEVFPGAWKVIRERFKDSPFAEFTAMGNIQGAEKIAAWMESLPTNLEWSPNFGDIVPLTMVELGKRIPHNTDPLLAGVLQEWIAASTFLRAGGEWRKWQNSENPQREDFDMDPLPTPVMEDIKKNARILGIPLLDIE